MRGIQRTWVTVDLDAIRTNLEQMKRRLPQETRMLAVVKTNAYGHGAAEVAAELEPLPYLYGFAVATAQEAFALRESGIHKPILVLGYTFPEDDVEMARQEIRPALFRADRLPELAAAAKEAGKPFRVHIKVDTGMSRIGIRPRDGLGLIRDVLQTPGLEAEGIFTHFARADEIDKTSARGQLAAFLSFTEQIRTACGVRIPLRHCANSAAILSLPEAALDLARAGIALYGIWPSDEIRQEAEAQSRTPDAPGAGSAAAPMTSAPVFSAGQAVSDTGSAAAPMPSAPAFSAGQDTSGAGSAAAPLLRPALSWHSTLVYVKTIEAGEAVSYGGTYVAPRRVRVATVPVGYGDGYPRSLSGKGYVLIGGRRAPVLGRVCMDQMMVDVTGIPEAVPGAHVVLLGQSGAEEITAQTLGDLSGRFPYELVCCIGGRVPRVYRKDGKERV